MAVVQAVHAPAAEPPPRLRVRVPAVVVPTLGLFLGMLALGALATWLALEHVVPAWGTVPMHVVAMTGMVVVLHECTHHAAGRLTWVNDVLGRLATPFVSAFGAFPAGRALHLDQHRQKARGHLTPWNLRGPAWQLPLRWMVTDLWYVWTYLKRTTARPQLEVAEALGVLVFVPGLLTAVVASGDGWQLLIVYLLPQRIALGLTSWWFDWFPRRLPADALSYHSVHSRYPSLPFYRYPQAWRADREPFQLAAPPPACPHEFHPLPVSGVRALTDRAVEIAFTLPVHLREEFRCAPGQHVVLRATVEGAAVARKYAVSSLPGDPLLRVAVTRVPGGQLSPYLTTQVRPGDRLEVRPPSGRFTLGASNTGKHVVAIAAGVGIAPLLPMLAHRLTTSPRGRATLLYINRSGADTIYAPELSALARRLEGRLRVEHFRTDERDPDLRHPWQRGPFDSIASTLAICFEHYHPGGLDPGRLRSLLDCRLHPAKVDEWLLCAPPDIAGPVLQALVEHHVPASAVRSERFCDG